MMRALLLSLFTLVLAGCSSILRPVDIPEVHTYTLSTTGFSSRAHVKHKMTLMVATPTASPGYQTKKMIYNKHAFELNAFSKNQWAGPPAQMLQPLILQSLRNTGYFHAVIAPPISAERHYRLAVNLIELRQDFTQSPSRVRMALQATVVDDTSSRVLASRVFRCAIATTCNTPYAGVYAANKANYRILGALALFCVNTIAHPVHDKYTQHHIKLPKPV